MLNKCLGVLCVSWHFVLCQFACLWKGYTLSLILVFDNKETLKYLFLLLLFFVLLLFIIIIPKQRKNNSLSEESIIARMFPVLRYNNNNNDGYF